MIVPSSPVVPGDEDRRGIPVFARTNRVDDACHPVWTLGRRAGVVRVVERGNDPRHLGELAAGYIGQNFRLGRDDVVIPVRPKEDMANGLVGGEDEERVAR